MAGGHVNLKARDEVGVGLGLDSGRLWSAEAARQPLPAEIGPLRNTAPPHRLGAPASKWARIGVPLVRLLGTWICSGAGICSAPQKNHDKSTRSRPEKTQSPRF